MNSSVVAYGGCGEYLIFRLLETFMDIFKRNSFATQHSYIEYISPVKTVNRNASLGLLYSLDVL